MENENWDWDALGTPYWLVCAVSFYVVFDLQVSKILCKCEFGFFFICVRVARQVEEESLDWLKPSVQS